MSAAWQGSADYHMTQAELPPLVHFYWHGQTEIPGSEWSICGILHSRILSLKTNIETLLYELQNDMITVRTADLDYPWHLPGMSNHLRRMGED